MERIKEYLQKVKEFFVGILTALKKLPRKQVALVTMCTMLSITAILSVVVAIEMAPLAGMLFQKPEDPVINQTTGTTEDLNNTEPSDTQMTQPTDPGHVHAYDIFVKTVKPTCTESGYSQYLCICGERTQKDIVKATGHSYGPGRLVSPSCEEPGYTEYTCTVCKYVEQKNKTAALGGHDYRLSESYEAACGVPGKDVYVCVNCANVKEEITAPAIAHKYELSDEKAATCTEKGYSRYTCTNEGCGDFYDDLIDADGHSFGLWVTTENPSAGNPGKETRECDVCHGKETRVCQLMKQEEKKEVGSDSTRYTVTVGAKNTQSQNVVVYTYEIFDKSGATLNFSYDQKEGLVIRFKDGSGGDKVITAKPGNATVTIDEAGNQVANNG